VLLSDGRVFTYGSSTGVPLLYDPMTGAWTVGAPASAGPARYDGYSTTLLPDGHVLVAGGTTFDAPNPNGPLSSADLYDPGNAP
jgi:hypothetical protein